MPSCCWSHLPLHHTLLDRGGRDVVALYVCNARMRRPLWRLDRIGSRGGDASMTTPTTFIWTFPLCDLQGYVDLMSPARCFASRRSDLDLFLFVIVEFFLFFYAAKPFKESLGLRPSGTPHTQLNQHLQPLEHSCNKMGARGKPHDRDYPLTSINSRTIWAVVVAD
jgi:hypothetical protein